MKEIRLGSGKVVKVVFEPCDTLEQVASRMRCDVYDLIEDITAFMLSIRSEEE